MHSCECQKYQKSRPTPPLHLWEWPEMPWLRIHADHAFLGEMFLLIVDALSNCLDNYPLKTTKLPSIIEKLRQSFSVFGMPKISDNAAFKAFMKQNCKRHVKSAPFHNFTLAERAVQTFKEKPKKDER